MQKFYFMVRTADKGHTESFRMYADRPLANGTATYVLSGKVSFKKPERETTTYSASPVRLMGGFVLPSEQYTLVVEENGTVYKCYSPLGGVGDPTMYAIKEKVLSAGEVWQSEPLLGVALISGSVELEGEVVPENYSKEWKEETSIHVKALADSVVAYAVFRKE